MSKGVVKGIVTGVGSLILMFAFFGFLYGIANTADKVERIEEPYSLNSINGIAVDSHGNLYYGNEERDCIQVFNNNGDFLYTFSFPTGAGAFNFYIDKDDYIHVATARSNSVFVFLYGDLVSSQIGTNDEAYEQYDTPHFGDEFYDLHNNKYMISLRKVKMYNAETGEYIRTISPQTPVWPFSIIIFWVIALCGMMMMVFANLEFIITELFSPPEDYPKS